MRPAWDQTWFGIAATLLAATLLTAVLAPLRYDVGILNAGLLFLLLTLLISARWGLVVGVLAALLTNLSLNFFFVEPLHTLTVQHPQNALGLAVFLGVSVVGGSLLSAARASAARARTREAETQVLLKLSRAMIGQTEPNAALSALCAQVVGALGAPGASVISRDQEGWRVLARSGHAAAGRPVDTHERALAERALASGATTFVGHTGLGTRRRVRIVRPSGTSRIDERSPGIAFVPLRVGDRVLGVLRLDGRVRATAFAERPDRLLDAFAGEAALAVQRVELTRAAAHAEALREADEMKSVLMASISHDLKTPLAGIKAAVSSLLDKTVSWSEQDRAGFLETIDSQADRLDRVISDILDLNRIESGAVAAVIRPVAVSDVLEEARERTAAVTAGRVVDVDAPPDLYARADESLLTHALVNLIENAAKYSTTGGAIRLAASRVDDAVEITVSDAGPGIPPDDLPHVFDRFFRGASTRRVRGSGLGLAIVKGFVDGCGGTVRVVSSEHGARFAITLPLALAAVTA